MMKNGKKNDDYDDIEEEKWGYNVNIGHHRREGVYNADKKELKWDELK